MIPPQKVAARAQSLKFAKSPKSGTECAAVVFLIEDGPQKGQTIEWTGWLTEKAVQRTGESLEYCGFDGSDETTVTKNLVQLDIQEKPVTRDDGTTYQVAEVAWVNPIGGLARFTPMNSGEQAAAKQRLKAAMVAARASKPNSAAPSKDEEPVRF